MNGLVALAKALADPTRVRILRAVREQHLCVCELADALGVTQSTLSTHLQVIREAGLVRTRKEGKWVYYGIDPNKEGIMEAIFRFFGADLAKDRAVRRDMRQLKARLDERENGACCRGFGRPVKGKCC